MRLNASPYIMPVVAVVALGTNGPWERKVLNDDSAHQDGLVILAGRLSFGTEARECFAGQSASFFLLPPF
jgi:hypothetical protein